MSSVMTASDEGTVRRGGSQTWEVMRFELRQHLRGPLFVSTASIFFLLAFLAMASENVTVGGGTDNLNLNASFAIVQTHYVFAILSMFVAVAFCATSVTHDYQTRTAELLMSTRLRPGAFLTGRFMAGWLAATAVAGAAVAGTLLGTFMPWLDPERIGSFDAAPYTYSIFVVIVPTLFVECALFFALAALTRTQMASYLGVLALIAFYVAVGVNTDQETIATTALLDPFGMLSFQYAARYWTVFDKNSLVPALEGTLLLNRGIWMALSAALLAVTFARFRLTAEPGRLWPRRRRAGMARQQTQQPVFDHSASLTPINARIASTGTSRTVRSGPWRMFLSQLQCDLRGVFRSIPFYVILLFGVLNTLGSIAGSLSEWFGTPVLPATQMMLPIISGTFTLAMFIVLVFYSAEVIHRERDTRMAAIIDATPVPAGALVAAKLTTLIVVQLALLAIAGFTAIAVQLANGFTDIRAGAYGVGLFIGIGANFYLLVPVAVFLQVALDRKYLAMLAFVVVFLAFLIADSAGFEHALYQVGVPDMPYTDMNGFGHYVLPFAVLFAYWASFGVLLSIAAHLLWQRGTESPLRLRFREAKRRLTPTLATVAAAFAVVWAGTGAYYFYNTNILNSYETRSSLEQLSADYEVAYKQYEGLAMPDVTDLSTHIDIYPDSRRVNVRADIVFENTGSAPISELHLTWPRHLTVTELTVPDTTEIEHDVRLGYQRFAIAPPLAPGATLAARYAATWDNNGFTNKRSNVRVLANGTFFDSTDVLPGLGYDRSRELEDNNKRRKHGLPPAQRMPTRGDPAYRDRAAFGISSRAQFKAVLSTQPDQIAIAPGYLQKEWQQDGRRYFAYEMDAPIWPFASFVSARYEVLKDHWNDVALEVYYDAAHPYNIPSMMEGAKRSLDYFSKAFSPYQYRQFRILEFPGYRVFAQSFPNTIPFSERIGFLADLTDPKDIDLVFYVTAHEMAHQWWGHQVTPQFTQGSTMIVESLAQYSALMVMEERFGREKMRRFLKYELDRYLSRRGGEVIEELPLALVEGQQYIHYQKGSLALYALKDYLGAEAVNRALKRFTQRFGMKLAPFPDTADLIAEFRAEARPDQQDLITDLFEKIVIYDLRIKDASVKQDSDGKYRVHLVADARKYYADGQGKETEAPLQQMLDIGIFGNADDVGDDDLPPVINMSKQAVKSGENTFDFVVDQKPSKVGIDPLNIMVDRGPSDNVKAL